MTTATDTFRWSEAYSVNIAVLDQQHKKLLATVNELDHALRTGEGNSVVEQVLTKFTEYASEHFATEEALMERQGYPGLSGHRAQHEEFRRKMTKFLEDYRAAKPGLPVSLMFFIQEWLKHHLQRADKQYSAFLNARGIR